MFYKRIYLIYVQSEQINNTVICKSQEYLYLPRINVILICIQVGSFQLIISGPETFGGNSLLDNGYQRVQINLVKDMHGQGYGYSIKITEFEENPIKSDCVSSEEQRKQILRLLIAKVNYSSRLLFIIFSLFS